MMSTCALHGLRMPEVADALVYSMGFHFRCRFAGRGKDLRFSGKRGAVNWR
jgi:hypothetical protein